MGKTNTVNDLVKKPLYSGYSTGFTLQTILRAYKVCLKKKSFPERWNSGYFTNKLKIKNGGHGNCELVQDSSHELKVKSYFNVISIMQTKRNFNAIKKYFFALKRGHGVTHVWRTSQYLNMRCLVFSVCQWHGNREKKSIILSRSISTFWPYKEGTVSSRPQFPRAFGWKPICRRHPREGEARDWPTHYRKKSLWSWDHFISQPKLSIQISEEHILIKLFSLFYININS